MIFLEDVLTNAHVVKPLISSSVPIPVRPPLSPYARLSVRVDFPVRRWLTDVEVLYVSYTKWDLAVLRLPAEFGPYPFIPIPEATRSLGERIGSPVYALGHGLFGPLADAHPTITEGLLSKVITSDGKDTMIQCSAPVHRGCSGYR